MTGIGYVCAAAALALASASASAASLSVQIENFTFDPATLKVVPGTTVTFVNRDDIPHLVAADDGAFRSKALDTGDAFSFTFEKAGQYGYFCALHPHMVGKVVVEP
ncbi:MAG: cupredoxin family copper-binding protein [Hyphomicrobiales bacterium]